MHITFTCLQFISICMGLGLLSFFWGTWSERRYLSRVIEETLRKFIP